MTQPVSFCDDEMPGWLRDPWPGLTERQRGWARSWLLFDKALNAGDFGTATRLMDHPDTAEFVVAVLMDGIRRVLSHR